MINWDTMTPEEWDVARRVSDAVNLHISVNEQARGWVACRMDTGESDGSLYDTRSDAVRHQKNESFCFYLKVQPGGMTAKQAWVNVVAFRKLRDAGIRPDHEDVTLPQRAELMRHVAPRLVLPRQYVPATFRRNP
jgi:hypothetical protein